MFRNIFRKYNYQILFFGIITWYAGFIYQINSSFMLIRPLLTIVALTYVSATVIRYLEKRNQRRLGTKSIGNSIEKESYQLSGLFTWQVNLFIIGNAFFMSLMTFVFVKSFVLDIINTLSR